MCKHNSGRSPRRPRAAKFTSRCRGLVSALAMLFLVVCSTLAVGFCKTTPLSSQVASDEAAIKQAQDAADGGMRFIHRCIAGTPTPAVSQSGMMTALANQLSLKLNGLPSVNGHTVQNTGGTICVAGPGRWITLDQSTGSKFRAVITQSGTTLLVTVTGCGPKSTIAKAIEFQLSTDRAER